MSNKEEKLKKRLDALENELKSLHCRIAGKRRQVPSSFKFVISGPKSSNRTNENANIYERIPVAKKKIKGKNEEKELDIPISHECWTYLKGISRNIAKGTEAIHKIASLTEISTLSGKLERNVAFRTYSNNDFKSCWMNEDVESLKKKSRFVQSRQKSTKKDTLENHVENLNRLLNFSQNIAAPNTPPTKDTMTNSELDSLKKEMEERLIDLRQLKGKIENLKRKLCDERTRREIAEKAVGGYKKRLTTLEAKLKAESEKKITDENTDDFNKLNKGKQEHNLSLEKELKSEIKKRIDTENRIKQLLIDLEESKRENLELEENRKWALEMAEKFRDRNCHIDNVEMERLKAKNSNLQEQLASFKEKYDLKSMEMEHLIERSEKAEWELFEKMKQYNALMARSTLSDTEVRKILEQQKLEYEELQAKKNQIEMELKNHNLAHEKEVKNLKSSFDKSYEDLNKKYNQVVMDLNNKEEAFQKLRNDYISFEREIEDLNSKLQNAIKTIEMKDQTITNMSENLKLSQDELKKLRAEFEEEIVVRSNFDLKIDELKKLIASQERTIESLREEYEKSQDTIKIKEKMLQDQVDTIKCLRTVSDNTKKTLDDERAYKHKLIDEVDKLQRSKQILQKRLSEMEKRLKIDEITHISLEEKNESLKKLENEVFSRQEELEKQLAKISYEKDQAIQTARFTTEKLVQVINDYETKLSSQDKIHNMLNESLREKEYQLDVANQQINELNEEVWKTARISEKIRMELQSQLRKACEMCTDAIDKQITKDL